MKRAAAIPVEEVLHEDCGYGHLLVKKYKNIPHNTLIEAITHIQQPLHSIVNTDRRIKSDRTRANISFTVTNDFDIKRRQSLDDIRQSIELDIEAKDRFQDIKFVIMCIIVSIDIKAPRTPFEPTALCLAERVRAYLLRDQITLSDETQTRLHVNRNAIRITLKDHPDDGLPIVGIGQAAFAFQVGEIVILQGTVISEPEATSIQWFKLEEDGTERTLRVDNKKYLGGCGLSPSLIITEAMKEDAGLYILEATNVNGTVRSTTSQLIILNEGEELGDWSSEDEDDADSGNETNTTDDNASTTESNTVDTDTSDTETATTNRATQNGNITQNDTPTTTASRANTSQNGVTSSTSSTEEDDKNTITAIVNEASQTLGEHSGNLATSLVSHFVDTTMSRVRAEYGSQRPDAEDDTSDDDREPLPGMSLTKEVHGHPVPTDRDSDDCSR